VDAKLLKDCYNFMNRGWRTSQAGNCYAFGRAPGKESILRALPEAGSRRDSIFWIFSFNFM
jgi:hypothetical protein